MPYGYIGSMRAKDGCRDDVIAILLSGADGLRAAGCQLYAVGTDLLTAALSGSPKSGIRPSITLPRCSYPRPGLRSARPCRC
jgi:hypothetical protein